jgi:hypothetical protein
MHIITSIDEQSDNGHEKLSSIPTSTTLQGSRDPLSSTTTAVSGIKPREDMSSKNTDLLTTPLHPRGIPSRPVPAYRSFDKTDVKSRLPCSFLDRSHRTIQFLYISQIFLGICTGILLNLSGVGASGAFVLILFPWTISIASFMRRFLRIRRVVKALRKGGVVDSGEAMDVAMPQGWERRTTRRGEWYFVDHTRRSTTWVAPEGYKGREGYKEKVEEHGEGKGVKEEGDEIRNVGSNEEV